MAGGLEVERDVFDNFNDIDSRVVHTPQQTGGKPSGEIIDQLEGDCDEDIVEETREILFKAASERYLNVLK